MNAREMGSKEEDFINRVACFFLDEANLQFSDITMTTASNLNNNLNPGGSARVVGPRPLDI